MKIKLTALLLCFTIATSALLSCMSSEPVSTSSTDAPAIIETAFPEDETTVPTDGLPEVDMNGFTLSILHNSADTISWAKVTLDVTEHTGDILNDAIYLRNQELSERFNCNIAVSESERNNMSASLKNNVMAGNSEIDLYLLYNQSIIDSFDYLLS